MNVGQVLAQRAQDRANHEALILRDRRLTFAEINAFANRLAHALEKKGIEQGDAVALIFPNIIELAILFWPYEKRGDRCLA
jgi:long-chain acyl-CoA synthetase